MSCIKKCNKPDSANMMKCYVCNSVTHAAECSAIGKDFPAVKQVLDKFAACIGFICTNCRCEYKVENISSKVKAEVQTEFMSEIHDKLKEMNEMHMNNMRLQEESKKKMDEELEKNKKLLSFQN